MESNFTGHKEISTPSGTRSLQIVGDGASWYLTVSLADDAAGFIADYRENDDLDTEFRESVEQLRPIVIDFNVYEPTRDAIAKCLAALGAFAKSLWLDTDYGWVIRGDKLLAEMRKNPNWDWRYDPFD